MEKIIALLNDIKKDLQEMSEALEKYEPEKNSKSTILFPASHASSPEFPRGRLLGPPSQKF